MSQGERWPLVVMMQMAPGKQSQPEARELVSGELPAGEAELGASSSGRAHRDHTETTFCTREYRGESRAETRLRSKPRSLTVHRHPSRAPSQFRVP